jgi:hypothetical protein
MYTAIRGGKRSKSFRFQGAWHAFPAALNDVDFDKIISV